MLTHMLRGGNSKLGYTTEHRKCSESESGQVLHTPCPEIWYGQLHMYFSGLKENLCSCSHLKSQALNFGTRSMKYIVHGLSYVDIIQKKIRDMKCEYCPCHILRDI